MRYQEPQILKLKKTPISDFEGLKFFCFGFGCSGFKVRISIPRPRRAELPQR
jgi:hypothetical protein